VGRISPLVTLFRRSSGVQRPFSSSAAKGGRRVAMWTSSPPAVRAAPLHKRAVKERSGAGAAHQRTTRRTACRTGPAAAPVRGRQRRGCGTPSMPEGGRGRGVGEEGGQGRGRGRGDDLWRHVHGGALHRHGHRRAREAARGGTADETSRTEGRRRVEARSAKVADLWERRRERKGLAVEVGQQKRGGEEAEGGGGSPWRTWPAA